MLSVVVTLLLGLSPRPASWIASVVTGAPASALLAICERESRCQRIGVHDRDAHLSRSSYVGQRQLGHLQGWCTDRRDGWATRGSWGLNAAAHWQFFPPCYQPSWLDVPLVSAVVAGMKWRAVCEGCRRSGWC